MDFGIPSELVLVLVLFGLLGAIGLIIKSRYRIVRPNEALIIAGTRRGGQDGSAVLKVVRGGGVFVWPILQQAFPLSLEVLRVNVEVAKVPTKNMVPIHLDSIANVRIGSSEQEINMAAMRFLSWKRDDIIDNVREVLSGSIRAIIGTMTVEEIIADREQFARNSQEIAINELQPMGVVIDVMNIREITDDNEYIHNLGVPRVMDALRMAEIAKNDTSLLITRSTQDTERQKAEITMEAEVKKADYQASIETAQMTSAQAGPLADAEARKQVVAMETEVAKLEAEKVQNELDARVKRPADAQAYHAKITAEGEREAAIARAEAEKKRLTLEGEGNAAKALAEGNAGADVERVQGLAQAEVEIALAKAKGAEIREVALAKAEGLRREAEALNELSQASVDLKRLEVMPEVVSAASAQLGSIQGLTIAGGSGLEMFVQLLPKLIDQALGVVKSQNGASTNGNGNGHQTVAAVAVPTTRKATSVAPGVTEQVLTVKGSGSDGEQAWDVDATDAKNVTEEPQKNDGLSTQLSGILAGIEGEDLASKLTTLRAKGGTSLETLAGSETLDNIVGLAESVDGGTLEDQVDSVLKLIEADPTLKVKVATLLPILQKFIPSLGGK